MQNIIYAIVSFYVIFKTSLVTNLLSAMRSYVVGLYPYQQAYYYFLKGYNF